MFKDDWIIGNLGHTNIHNLIGKKLNRVLDVLDYGAKGDGITDDTAAFQTAIASGLLIIPRKSTPYLISQALTHSLNCRIISDGATLKATAPMNYMLGNTQANANVLFRCNGLILDANGQSTNGASWYQVNNHASGANDIWVKNAVAEGIKLTLCQGGRWSGLRASSCGRDGLLFQGCNSALFEACSAMSNLGNGIVLTSYNTGQAMVSGGCSAIGLHSEGNGINGIYIKDILARTLLSGGWIEHNTLHGILIENAVFGATITGLRISGDGTDTPENHAVHLINSTRAVYVHGNFLARSTGATSYARIYQDTTSVNNVVTPNWDGGGNLL